MTVRTIRDFRHPRTGFTEKVIYDLLFRTSAETLLEVARDPRLLGAEIGFFSVLHTWSQQLNLHPHAHIVIPAGGHHTMDMRGANQVRERPTNPEF